jgi:hypothetical protein
MNVVAFIKLVSFTSMLHAYLSHGFDLDYILLQNVDTIDCDMNPTNINVLETIL